MKKIISSLIILFAAVTFISSCKDEDLIAENNKWVYTDTANNANVRLIHCFAGNTPQLPTATGNTGPQIFVYANGAKLNGNALSYGGQWPSQSVYASIPQTGNVRFDVVMARLNFSAVPVLPAPIVGDTLVTINTTLNKSKYYSIFFGDTVGGPFKFEVKEDNFQPAVGNKYKIRLANWTMNPRDTFDVFSLRENNLIIQSTSHKNISNWVELNVPVVPDTFLIRLKGTVVSAVAFNGFSPTPTRQYSLVTRGKFGVPGKGTSVNIVTNY